MCPLGVNERTRSEKQAEAGALSTGGDGGEIRASVGLRGQRKKPEP